MQLLSLNGMKNSLLEEAPLLRLAVCLMAGIVVGQYVAWPWMWLLVVSVAAALLSWRWEQVQSVVIAVSFVVLGALLIERQEQGLRVAWPEGDVMYEAVVVSEPVEKPKTMAVDLLLAGSGRRLKCYLHKDERSRRLRVGDGLRIQSRILPNRDYRIGTFDHRRYLEIHGFTGSTFVSSWKWQRARVSLGGLSRVERTRLFFLRLRSRLLERLRAETAGADDAYAVVAAMTLGDKSALTRELKDVYSVTGASHVLALSGLHMGIVYTLLSLLLGGSRSLFTVHCSLFTIAGLWAFVLLAGMPVSVVRAAVMLTAYALLSLGRRNRMSVNTLAFTAIVLLMVSPLSLFDVGFQLSFLSVLSILLWLPLADRVVSPRYQQQHRVVGWLWSMVTVSCAAQIGVAPLVAYYFGRLPLAFLLTNFVVVPAATLALWLSPVVLAVPSLAYLLLYIVGWVNRVLSWIAAIPGASIGGLHPSVLQVTMWYVVIGALWMLFRIATSRGRG